MQYMCAHHFSMFSESAARREDQRCAYYAKFGTRLNSRLSPLMHKQLGSTGSTTTLGKIYPNDFTKPNKRQCSATPELSSQGSLLVNVSEAGRNVCKASKQGCGGKGACLYNLKSTHDVQGKKIKKRELRIGVGGSKRGGRCVVFHRILTQNLPKPRDWRHWRCLTPAFIENMKVAYPTPDSLPGFMDLSSLHQTRVRNTYNPPKPSRRKEVHLEATRRSTRLA